MSNLLLKDNNKMFDFVHIDRELILFCRVFSKEISLFINELFYRIKLELIQTLPPIQAHYLHIEINCILVFV